jgi:polyhydroxyalkanoate synthesis regulator protein
MVNFVSDESEQERVIEAKTREITELFHHAEIILKNFSKFAENKNISAAERSVRQNMQKSFAKKLQTLSMQFRATQYVQLLLL